MTKARTFREFYTMKYNKTSNSNTDYDQIRIPLIKDETANKIYSHDQK